jgi:predicted metal-dependent hydrolase
LMNLPFELIDYVLSHELAHTVHLNHSKEFWSEVARLDPDFKTHRKSLKSYNPSV